MTCGHSLPEVSSAATRGVDSQQDHLPQTCIKKQQPTNGELTRSAPDSLASQQALPAAGSPKLTSDGFGQRLPASSMFYDRESSSWKTRQGCLFGPQPTFSGTWPRAGLMLSGRVYRLPLWVRLIKDGEFWLLLIGRKVKWRFRRLLPTPTVSGNNNRKGASKNSGDGLATAVLAMVPTPRESDGTHGGEQLSGDLLARMHPSPRADSRDNAGGSNSRRTAKANGTYFGRTINPEYVEWLQGFPIGWTDLEDSATPSSRKSPNG